MARELHSDDTKIEQPDQPNPLADLAVLLRGLMSEKERKPEIIVADPKLTQDYLDELAFMAEWVTIRLEQSNEENAATTFPVWVNGEGAEVLINDRPIRMVHLPVGPELTVRRSVVEVIARSKTMRVSTEHSVESLGQQLANTIARPSRRVSQSQPFSIVNDPSPRGRAWATEMIRRGF